MPRVPFLIFCCGALYAVEAGISTPLLQAAYDDDLPAVRRLLKEGADVKAVNRYGVTALSLACTNGNAEMVKLFLAAGADPNSALPEGETALMTCARTGKIEAVKALLVAGANVHAKETRRGQTAIMWAAAEGHTRVVEEFIESGADFRAELSSGFSPLFFAVREGHIGVVKLLLKAGADVNATLKGGGRRTSTGPGTARPGTTPLILAAMNGHFELGAVLLDHGADPNAIGPGYTALHAVTVVRRPGVGDNDPAPAGSGAMTSLEFVKRLKEKGADLNARMTKKVNLALTSLNTLGATAFLLAAKGGDAELMRHLASLGADPLIPNADNAPPIIAAAGLGTRSPGEDAGTEAEVLEGVQAALDLGADINAVDNNGETVMHGAAYKNLPAVVELLYAKGAKPEVWNKKNKNGWTPLIIAEGYRFGNYKPSPPTIEAFHKVMKAAGIPIPPPTEPGTVFTKTY